MTRQTRANSAVAIVAVAILGTALAGAALGRHAPKPHPHPTPTVRPTATPIPTTIPTPTVVPTATPIVISTATPIPTLTPSVPLVITADNVTVSYKSFSGSSGYGIFAVGTASNHITNLTISHSSFQGFDSAIWVGFVDNVTIVDSTIDGAKYAGIMVLSAVGGTVQGNTVRKIGFGQPALTNAYGIAISQQNPATDPPSSDVLVLNNVVEDVPTWEALDTHGGIRTAFRGNVVRRSRRGVMVTSSSSTWKARDTIVDGNQFLSPISVPVGDQYAVVLVEADNTKVTNNTITGWGTPDTTRAYLRVSDTNTVISGNTITP